MIGRPLKTNDSPEPQGTPPRLCPNTYHESSRCSPEDRASSTIIGSLACQDHSLVDGIHRHLAASTSTSTLSNLTDHHHAFWSQGAWVPGMTTTSRRPHQWPRLATSTYISDIINALPGRCGYASGHSSTHKVRSDSHKAGKSRLTHSHSGREHRRCSSSNAFCTQSFTYLISMNLTVVGPGLLSQVQHITLNNGYTKHKAGWPSGRYSTIVARVPLSLTQDIAASEPQQTTFTPGQELSRDRTQ